MATQVSNKTSGQLT